MKKEQRMLQTERLILRPFRMSDAPAVQQLANNFAITNVTRSLPFPYTLENAESWISTHAESYAKGTGVEYAISLKDGQQLIGATGLMVAPQHHRAELGYWLGEPFWGNGFCTEAAGAMLEAGFIDHDFHKIMAVHLARNPASGRVMEKIGMEREGFLKEHDLKSGVHEDIVLYGILKKDWLELQVAEK